MKTFKQVIDAFVAGATTAIEGTPKKSHGKLAIYSNTLIWITEKDIQPIAIRLSNDLILKNTDWDIISKMSELKYLTRKCSENKITILRDEIVTLPKDHITDSSIKTLERAARKTIGESLLNNKLEVDISKPIIDYKKNYRMEKETTIRFNTLKASISSYDYINKGGVIDRPTLKAIISNVSRSQQILQQLTEYLQVCITLPEISSPGTNGPEEQPGGNDSDPSNSSE